MKEQLIEEMKSLFGSDQRRINHALSVLASAERLLETEPGDKLTVIASAILHDIGIQEAARKHNSVVGKYQELEGPPIARPILKRVGIDDERIEHICRIIANHHSARDIDTPEFRIIWDSDWLVNIPEEYPEASAEKKQRLIERIFRTPTGRSTALALFA